MLLVKVYLTFFLTVACVIDMHIDRNIHIDFDDQIDFLEPV